MDLKLARRIKNMKSFFVASCLTHLKGSSTRKKTSDWFRRFELATRFGCTEPLARSAMIWVGREEKPTESNRWKRVFVVTQGFNFGPTATEWMPPYGLIPCHRFTWLGTFWRTIRSLAQLPTMMFGWPSCMRSGLVQAWRFFWNGSALIWMLRCWKTQLGIGRHTGMKLLMTSRWAQTTDQTPCGDFGRGINPRFTGGLSACSSSGGSTLLWPRARRINPRWFGLTMTFHWTTTKTLKICCWWIGKWCVNNLMTLFHLGFWSIERSG